MERIRKFLALLIALGVMGVGLIGYAQPKIPKENIPSDIPSEIRKEIEKLYSVDSVEREWAIEHLRDFPERVVPTLPFLIGLLHDNTKTKIRKSSGFRFWDEKGEQTTIISQDISADTIGLEVAKLLVEIGMPAIEPLITALKDEDSTVRTNAEFALKKITGQDFGQDSMKWKKWWGGNPGDSFIALLGEENEQTRKYAKKMLVQMGKAAVEPLIAALNDKSSDVRNSAAEALVKINDPRAVKPLIAAFKDENLELQLNASAIILLGNVGDKSITSVLAKIMNDENESTWLRQAAATALGKIGGESSFMALVEILRSEDEGLVDEASQALGVIGDKSAVPYLLEASKRKSKWIRRGCAIALGKIGDKSAVPALAELLKDSEYDVQCKVTEALEKIVGENFREDSGGISPYKCEEWWEKNKEKFSKGMRDGMRDVHENMKREMSNKLSDS